MAITPNEAEYRRHTAWICKRDHKHAKGNKMYPGHTDTAPIAARLLGHNPSLAMATIQDANSTLRQLSTYGLAARQSLCLRVLTQASYDWEMKTNNTAVYLEKHVSTKPRSEQKHKNVTHVAPAMAISSGFAFVNTARVAMKHPTPITIVTTRAVRLVSTKHRAAGMRIIIMVRDAITERAMRGINGCSKINTLESPDMSPLGRY